MIRLDLWIPVTHFPCLAAKINENEPHNNIMEGLTGPIVWIERELSANELMELREQFPTATIKTALLGSYHDDVTIFIMEDSLYKLISVYIYLQQRYPKDIFLQFCKNKKVTSYMASLEIAVKSQFTSLLTSIIDNVDCYPDEVQPETVSTYVSMARSLAAMIDAFRKAEDNIVALSQYQQLEKDNRVLYFLIETEAEKLATNQLL
jgi:hypothetical protein